MSFLIQKRILLIITLFIFFLSFFPTYFILNPEQLRFDINIFIGVSVFSSILFSIPIVYVYIKHFKDKFLSLFLISLYAILIENIAIVTGFPYSKFEYSNLMGPKLFFAPVTLPFAWIPIFFLSLVLVYKIKNKFYKIILGGLIMTYFDLVLDPGATNLGFWIWENKSGFYNVPYINFLGWILTSTSAFVLWEKIWPKFTTSDRQEKILLLPGIFVLSFFMGVNFWLRQYIPLMLGLILLVYVYKKFFIKSN